MKQVITSLLEQALAQLRTQGLELPTTSIQIERTKDRQHGDYSSNVAMVLAKAAKTAPRALAQSIVDAIDKPEWLETIAIAGPGFINFSLSDAARRAVILQVLQQKEAYGESQMGAGKRVMVEFVSANPTGPLHVGHGRGAAYGSMVSRLLHTAGYSVHREYYVNDAGRQMDILATSVWLRYLEACGEQIPFPSNGYKGEYVVDIAHALHLAEGVHLLQPAAQVFSQIPADEPQGGDKELHIDALVEKTKTLLGESAYRRVFDYGLHAILQDIREDLAEFGAEYDAWFSERSLVESGVVDKAIAHLKQAGALYQQDGAWWFRSTDYGDEKDRVVIRENGQATYFASDIAYHLSKFERGFDALVNIWGADHHGYIPRVKAAMQSMQMPVEKLSVLLVQFAILYRGQERVSMSTRAGEFVTLRALRQEVGNDATRFFYVLRSADQHMDFDLELAKSQSQDNPVYYVQYAHARICSVLRQAQEKQLSQRVVSSEQALTPLNEQLEQDLMVQIARYPEVIESAAHHYAPHYLAHYLQELARDFHAYYNAHPFLVDDWSVTQARLLLIQAVQQVLANALSVLGVSAPEKM